MELGPELRPFEGRGGLTYPLWKARRKERRVRADAGRIHPDTILGEGFVATGSPPGQYLKEPHTLI